MRASYLVAFTLWDYNPVLPRHRLKMEKHGAATIHLEVEVAFGHIRIRRKEEFDTTVPANIILMLLSHCTNVSGQLEVGNLQTSINRLQMSISTLSYWHFPPVPGGSQTFFREPLTIGVKNRKNGHFRPYKVWISYLRKLIFLICCPDIQHSLEPILVYFPSRQIIEKRLVCDLPGGRHDIRRGAF